MTVRFNDDLESAGPFPLVGAAQLGDVVTDVTLAGSTLTVHKKSATQKATTNTTPHELPSAEGGLTATQRGTLAAIGKVGRDAADGGDGGVVAVQQGAVNISIANTHAYSAEGEIGAYTLSTQTASPRVMVGIKNELVDDLAQFTVLYNGDQLTPDLAQDDWSPVSGGRVGSAAAYTWYQILLSGVTMNAGAVSLQFQAQIPDALIPTDRVEDYAVKGKANRLPVARLTQNIPETQFDAGTRAKLNRPAGLGAMAVDARIQAAKANLAPLMVGWLRGADYEPGGAQIGNSPRWAASNHRHALSTKQASFWNAVQGEGWNATTKIQFAVTTAGGTALRFDSAKPGANAARAFHYTTSAPDDVSPRRVNVWITARVSDADADKNSLRINNDVGGGDDPNPKYIVLGQDQDNNFEETDRWTDASGDSWVAYSYLAQNLPVGATLGGEEHDPLEFNLDLLDIQNIISALHDQQRLGTTTLGDGPGVGLFISSIVGNSRSTFTLFSPTFDADDAANQHGLAIGRVTLTLSGRSSTSTGFGPGHDTKHRFGGYVSYRDMEESSAFNSAALFTSAGLAGGVALDAEDYYDGTSVSGTVTCYIAKNAANEWGYYYEYIHRTGHVGSGHTNVASNLALFYEHSGVRTSPAGPSLTAASITDAASIATPVDVYFTTTGVSGGSVLPNSTTWTPWFDLLTYTIPASLAGVNDMRFQIHAQTDEQRAGDGRVWADLQITRTRASVDTVIGFEQEYIRNVQFGPSDNLRTRLVPALDMSVAGDVIKLQGRIAAQTPDATAKVTWGASNELKILHPAQ